MRDKEYSRKSKLKSKRLVPANYLIVCEGKQTEPNYFNGLKKRINEKYGNKVDVLIPSIEVKGTGKNTTDLVSYTGKFVDYSNKRYGQVGVYLIKMIIQMINLIKQLELVIIMLPGLILILNFGYYLKRMTKYISKDDILKELDKEFQKNGLGEYKKYDENGQASQRNPMTQAYKVVEGLNEYLE